LVERNRQWLRFWKLKKLESEQREKVWWEELSRRAERKVPVVGSVSSGREKERRAAGERNEDRRGRG
jgi:hypothetical protein